MSLPYWIQKKDRKSLKVNICIVGAGLSGLSTAYWLKKEDPALEIVLVDKGLMGGGATGRNAGFVTCGSVEHFNRMVSKHGEDQALEIWQFAETNLEMLKKEIIQDQASSYEFSQKGAFSLASSPTEMKELEQVAEMMEKRKIPVESLSEKQVRQRLGVESFVGGIKYLGDGSIDPYKLLQGLLQKSQVSVLENQDVRAVEESSGGTRIVDTKDYKIECDIVIYCLNGYSSSLVPFLSDKIYPTRGQIMVLGAVPSFMEGPCYANFYLDYFRQLQDGSLLIGGFRQMEADTEKGFSDHTTEGIQQALHDFVQKHLPQYSQAPVTHRWSGVMGFASDGEPIIGALPTDPQSFFCGGYTGHGIGMAFHVAYQLVNLIFDRPIPDWLSARRF